jgi:iron complex outermembrane receptor protein
MKQLLLILTLIFSAGLTAQEIKVSGVVTDDTKQPLPGTSILVKGTSREPQPMLMESI